MRSFWIILILLNSVLLQAQKTVDNQFDKDLILYLPLNGNIEDASSLKNSSYSHSIQPVKDRSQNTNGAFYFGNGGSISIDNVSNFNGLTAFTITGWIYLDKYTEHNTIISKVDPGRDFNLQVQKDGTLNFHTYKNGYIHFNSQEKIPLNQWVQVTFIYTGKIFQMYINGEQKKFTINFEGAILPMEELKFNFSWTGEKLTIGDLYPYGYENLSGAIDDLRVYKRVLSFSEIKKMYVAKNNDQGVTYPLGDFNNSGQYKHVIDNDTFQIGVPADQKEIIDPPLQEIKLEK
ncbi:hypothetical protein HYN56_01205 [Flavobacterium crocinum]|uniref:LamG-like jellyroll fold domain-containing protein n=1 Tax=Flavobacterium crocinum TaxID=2183896 RepID=A0A2S1YFT5_9FLAO|nr:LamG domain-containing protein [Flavobacterium crocinum]AWK02903.1 hypothetical protein HYN56_01205 [Flavobacterium crocinum]